MKINKKNDLTDYEYYAINNVFDNKGWFTLIVTSIDDSVNFTNGDIVEVCFARTGDKGDTGEQAWSRY